MVGAWPIGLALNAPLLGLGRPALEHWVQQRGQAAFRGRQLHDWLYSKGVRDLDQVSVLPKQFRQQLLAEPPADAFDWIGRSRELQRSVALDGTTKLLLATHDGLSIETVGIPNPNRLTVCVSSQVGCAMACRFCATGKGGFQRSLALHEIVDQVLSVREVMQQRPSHVVFMGMGEPLLNYGNVLEGIHKITSQEGMNMAAKRITVSTAGVAKMIKKLADDEVRFNLALSLHAANDEKRDKIMPINETNNLEVLLESLNYFKEKVDGEITFEYIIFNDFNDSIKDAQELTDLAKKIGAKVNIIEYNKVDKVTLKKATSQNRDLFVRHLERNGVIAKVRRSRGKDIDAACGQLANKN